jgi:signal transduction histidine kinase
MAGTAGQIRSAGKGAERTSAIEGPRFEQFIEELSSAFVRASVPEIGAEFDSWIRKIVLDLDVDRGALAQLDPRSGKLTVRHSWSRNKLPKLPVGLEFAGPAPWFDRVLMQGRSIAFANIQQLPPEFFSSDWKTFRRYVPTSNVSLPLRMGDEVVGAVGFGTLRRERTWPPRTIHRLEHIAHIFGNAIQRRWTAEQNTLLRNELYHLSRTAAMGELTASITHQLSQPLSAILSNAESIVGMFESAQPDLQEVSAAALDIVQDVLQTTEIIKCLRELFYKGPLTRTALDFAALVDAVVRLVRGDALVRHVAIGFDRHATPIHVAGDRIQLQQLILNLVLNALDAASESKERREVSIALVASAGLIKLSVHDTGKGIKPELISRIFEPFFTTKPKGMGMGLAVARSIAKAHAGELVAVSIPERGSTFELSLPVLTESGKTRAQPTNDA